MPTRGARAKESARARNLMRLLTRDLALPLAEVDAHPSRERHAATRLDGLGLTAGTGTDPAGCREVAQAPHSRQGRMSDDLGGGLGEVIQTGLVQVVRIEPGIVIEHHEVPADLDAWRQRRRPAARPARR